MQIENINDSVVLALETSEKFSVNIIRFTYYLQLSSHNICCMNLLKNIMMYQCAKYPTKVAFNQQLDELYGASVHIDVKKNNKQAIMEFTISALDQSKVSQNLLEEQIAFLKDIICYPVSFVGNIFEEAKMMAYASLKNSLDNPSKRAMLEGVKQYYNDDQLSINLLGDLDVYQSLTMDSLKQMYEELMNRSYLIISGLGNMDFTYFKDIINKNFVFSNSYELNKELSVINNREVSDKVDYNTLAQSELVMGFYHPYNVYDQEYEALLIGNMLFGRLPSSLLFTIVREKHSLCYSISSTLLSLANGLVVSCGIDKTNFELTKKLILECLEKMQKADYDDNLIDSAKNIVINILLTNSDYLSMSLDNLNSVIYYGDYVSVDKRIERIKMVSKDDITKVMNQIKLQSIYLYAQGDNNGKDN
ncbi:MAG: insulinase family protein [Erysipelotrichaceae bacterium]